MSAFSVISTQLKGDDSYGHAKRNQQSIEHMKKRIKKPFSEVLKEAQDKQKII